jgi:ubiquitin C-terminal hydrolase
MTCDLCGATTFDTKDMHIFEAGQILVLSFKRFLDGRKNEANVLTPEFLEPREVVSESQVQSYRGLRYRLYAAIIHYGSLQGGHYIAVCYNYKSRKWVKYNDSNTSESSQRFDQIDFSQAMTLFY